MNHLRHLYRILTTVCCLALVASCRQEPAQRWYVPDEISNATDTGALWGHWVCSDFFDLAEAKLSVRSLRSRPIFIEMEFSPHYADSVLLITGYNNFFAPYERAGTDSLIIKNILPGKNLVLYAGNLAEGIMFEDSLRGTTGELDHKWHFVKAGPYVRDKDSSVFYAYLNAALLKGKYLPQNSQTKDTVIFTDKGQINNWQFTTYTVCPGGSCFSLVAGPIDIITLDGENYGMVIKSDKIEFYTLKPDKKGSRYKARPVGIAFTLLKVE